MNLEEQLRTYGVEVERLAIEGCDDIDLADAVDAREPVEVAFVEPPRRRSMAIIGAVAAAVVLVVVTVLVTTRSGNTNSVVDAGPTDPTTTPVPDDPSAIPPPPAEPDAPVSLWFSANRVPPGPVEVVAVLVDHAGTSPTFGVDAAVERWTGREWEPLARMVMCLDHWFCTATVVPGQGPDSVPSIGLSAGPDRPGPIERFTLDGLDPGWYRISQTANEGMVATGVIEVVTDALAPAPLLPLDRTTIQVQPVVAPPAGGNVFLTPLVPDVKDVADLEAAVVGLSEEAVIERWQREAWEPMATVLLSPSVAQIGSRTATVPVLPAGEYRIVRTGPNGEHVGRFWVADLTARQAMPSGPDTSSEPIDVVAEPVPTTTTSVPVTSTSGATTGPRLQIDPAGPYVDRQHVTVRGWGFEPGERLAGKIGQCPADLDTAKWERCGYVTDVDASWSVGDDGTFSVTGELRVVTPFEVDCRVAPGCVLAWVPPKQSMEAAIPLEFEPE